MNGLNQSILKFVNAKNKKKIFTPGPGSLLSENILGLGPFFGRGDIDYLLVEEYVMKSLKKISGFNKIVSFQGSGTLAIEMAFQNFLKGKILIINSGYYSLRLLKIAKILKKNFNQIKKINVISWKKLNKIKGKYNWI